MFEITIGEEGLKKTWQAKFPETAHCSKCGGEARHGFTAKEGFSGEPGKGHVCDLHINKEGEYWLHDCCAVAVYFCKDCLSPTAKYNQG